MDTKLYLLCALSVIRQYCLYLPTLEVNHLYSLLLQWQCHKATICNDTVIQNFQIYLLPKTSIFINGNFKKVCVTAAALR